MIHRVFFLCCVFVLVLSGIADAQRVLLLHSPGKQKHFFYKVGDQLLVQTGSPSYILGGNIIQISDNFCLLDNKLPVVYDSIQKVYRQRVFFKIFNAPKLVATSAFYTGFSVINHTLNGEELFDNTIPIVAGSALAAAFVSYKCKKRTFKYPKWKFKVLDL